MENYIAPGVYTEAFDSGMKPMDGVGTSTAGFVGLAEKGPITGQPVLIRSFSEYRRWFGEYLSEEEYRTYRFLPYAVEQFFANGGMACYVMRVAPGDTAVAKHTDEVMQITALSPGTWGNGIQLTLTRCVRACTRILRAEPTASGTPYQLENATGFQVGDVIACRMGDHVSYHKITALNGSAIATDPGLPDNVVDPHPISQYTLEACGVDFAICGGGEEEKFSGCSLNPAAPEYLPTIVKQSTLVSLSLHEADKTGDLLVVLGGTAQDTELRFSLCGGTNGTLNNISADVFRGTDGGPGKRTGIEAFQEIHDVSILAVPGVTDANVQAKLIAHCEHLGNRFAVLDAPLDCTSVDALITYRSAYNTSYAALYAPWIQIYDSLLKRPTYMPPSGSVCGIYARVDITRGVHKAPANEVVKECTGLSALYNQEEQGTLARKGVNLICAIPKQGIRVWGARTCSNDDNWKHINVRRLSIFLEESIRVYTSWAMYEPNDECLWNRVKSTVSLFLESQRRNGILMGATPDQAYYVKVGHDTMTQNDILSGQLICEIGIAAMRPTVFLPMRITHSSQNKT